jgi:hypothetical protein
MVEEQHVAEGQLAAPALSECIEVVAPGEAGQTGQKAFTLPYGVCTLPDLQQRAYINKDGKAEWVWARVHSYCQIQKEPGRMLMHSKDALLKELGELQVPEAGLHYRGMDTPAGEPDWKDHTLESSTLLGALVYLSKLRQLKENAKVKAMKLLLELAGKALPFANLQQPVPAMLQRPTGPMASAQLFFTPQGLTQDWGKLLALSPGGAELWKRLGTRTWLNRCIASSLENATFQDILFFNAYLMCHPKVKGRGQLLWTAIGSTTLPELVFHLGTWLDALALAMKEEPLQMLPILKTKEGNARLLADPVNRMLLLWKLRRSKQHRLEIAGTHGDLGGNTMRMMRYEAYLDCLLHSKALEYAFSGYKQVCVSWDPSSYGGKDIFIGCLYVPQCNQAAYLMSQHLGATYLGELDGSLLELGQARKLTRLEGYREVKGLSSSLEGVGLSLKDFFVPEGLVLRPLAPHELRIQGPGGRWYIQNEKTGETKPEAPEDFDFGALPALISISDQGPANTAALNYLMFSSKALLLWSLWDPYHRAWNDFKLALKRCAGDGWRTVLELTLVANMNYGPFGSGSWFFKKKAKLQDFLMTRDVNSPAWNNFQHLICQERRVSEPSNLEEAQELFTEMASLQSFNTKGPLVKLMRWFSFFESMAFLDGEFYMTKLILLHAAEKADAGSEAEIDEGLPQEKDHKKELAELKKRKGTWRLAPSLINGKSLCMKDCIMACGKAIWQNFSERAREICSPMQVKELNIACAQSRFWAFELLDMLESSLEEEKCLKHLFPEFQGHESAMTWHCDLLAKLLETRAMSLAVFYLMPPSLYCHLLSYDPEVSREAHDLARKHWGMLLAAEEAHAAGATVKPLSSIYWRFSPLIRALFMAFEEDARKCLVYTTQSQAMRLQLLFTQHLGDSRLIENIHQHGRDLCRASKSNSMSNVSIMANVLRCGVLEGRKVPMVAAKEIMKATGMAWHSKNKEPVVQKLRTHGKKLPVELQQMMAPNKKGNEQWPSPSPGSLFQSCCSTDWLFHYFSDQAATDADVNSAWLSCLARPGAILAQQSTSSVVMVIASAEYSFLGVAMEAKVGLTLERTFHCVVRRDSIGFHHITDLDDWLELQVEPCLTTAGGTRGPIGWRKIAEPLTLDAAALLKGITLTFLQLKDLVVALGGSKKGIASKKAAIELLITMAFAADKVEEVKAMYAAEEETRGDEQMDSDLSELVSELGQDDANTQDLKDLKEKKQAYRQKKALKKAEQQVLLQGKEKSRKGRGKGKGKAKGKAQAKPKEEKPKTFLQSVIRRAKKLAAQRDQGAMAEIVKQERHVEMEVATEMTDDPEQVRKAKAAPAEEADVDMNDLFGDAVPEGPDAGAAPSSSSQPHQRAPKTYKSPDDILGLLNPPGCKFTLRGMDHRFKSEWEDDLPELDHPYSQKRFSASFAKKRTWQDALSLVHERNWQKWNLVKDEYLLGEGEEPQKPGVIPQELQDLLQVEIAKLGKPKTYAKGAAGVDDTQMAE